MKTSHLFFFAFLLLGNGYLFSTDMDSSFSVKWENDSWGSGGLFPAGPPWNMVGPYDFDNDGFGGVGGSLIVDPDGNILQQSGGSPFVQTAIVDFDRVSLLREKGVASVSHPWKDFRQNKQTFNVYNKNSKS